MHLLPCLLCAALLFLSCRGEKPPLQTPIDGLAAEYVRLGLAIGQYDPDFVDAYYGPDSLKPASPKQASFPKDSFLRKTSTLQAALASYLHQPDIDTRKRAQWLSGQLKAFERRIRIFAGELAPFDEESKDLFGLTAPVYSMAHFDSLLGQLDLLLAGKGSLESRYRALADRFIVPADKLDMLFKTTIAEAARRTQAHYPLPAGEAFRLEYVSGKPWSGYNWYQGNYQSLIQINTDLPIYIERIIDVGCHESYPGHHVYNMLLEHNLYRKKGWVEISLYPLFSPQSLIAEGSANYGIDVVFPGCEWVDYAGQVLLPLAGMDTTGIETYSEALRIHGQLNYARNEVARALLSGQIDEAEAARRLVRYNLATQAAAEKSVAFIRKYRSYVLCYNYGQDLVRHFVEARGGVAENPQERWKVFGDLLSNPVTSSDLQD